LNFELIAVSFKNRFKKLSVQHIWRSLSTNSQNIHFAH
jgi:hypothetical protein